MSIYNKITTIPVISKYLFNRFAPFQGAAISIEKLDLKNAYIRVKMPLTRKNKNIVGVHFGGSLYAMVDPFYMTILMYHLGDAYIVWDKTGSIDFLTPGRDTVYADIRIDHNEIALIKELASNHAPVYRNYSVNILDATGLRIAEVHKTVYIRKKKPKPTRFRSVS